MAGRSSRIIQCLLAILFLNPFAAYGVDGSLQSSRATSSLWTSDETTLTFGVLAGAAAFSLLDESIRHQVQKNHSESAHDVADGVALAGHAAVTLGLSGVLWGVGTWAGDEHLASTGVQALEAIALGQVGCAMMKVTFGRKRPDPSEDAAFFKPFSLDDDFQSLPSSHTASAFALASVLAKRSDTPYAPLGYYGLATLVGLARIYQDEHWTSDVIVGALVGELAGRLVVHWNEEKRQSVLITPYAGDSVGFLVQIAWP